jgi:hypothetical protein
MQPNLIRQTLDMLEAVEMELVANRDFVLVAKTMKDGKEYALGNTEHNDKFYPQEFYTQVESLKVGSYGTESEALEEFEAWVEKI